MNKPKVLFVGSFLEKAKDGGVGGQMFACRTLIHSHLRNLVDFILLDTTSESVPPPPLSKRAWNAFVRLLQFIRISIVQRPDRALIFCGDGYSLLEKGTMSLFFKIIMRRPVILAPRSGFILNDVKNSKFMRWFISLLVNKVDILICQGDNWKSFFFELSDRTNPDKFVSIPNWIDIQSYVENRSSGIETKSDNQNLKILYLGWIEETKGILDLLEAIRLIKPQLNDQEFIIAGDGRFKKLAEDRVREFGLDSYVKFYGWADRKAKMSLLKEADVYVFPSHFEGYPNSVLEAMASELPVVSTRVGAVPEMILDGVNGLLVDIKDVKALSAALLKLIEEPETRIRLSKNARESAIKRNSIESAVEQFQKILIHDEGRMQNYVKC